MYIQILSFSFSAQPLDGLHELPSPPAQGLLLTQAGPLPLCRAAPARLRAAVAAARAGGGRAQEQGHRAAECGGGGV